MLCHDPLPKLLPISARCRRTCCGRSTSRRIEINVPYKHYKITIHCQLAAAAQALPLNRLRLVSTQRLDSTNKQVNFKEIFFEFIRQVDYV